MRKLLVMTLITGICFPIYAKYSGGTGGPSDPYLIETPEDLNSIGLDPNDWNKHFKMISDINLCNFTGTELNLIGDVVGEGSWTSFSGTFDGNGHIISNFTYDTGDEGTDWIGLFRIIEGPNALIKDLGIIDPNIRTFNSDNNCSFPNCAGGVGPLAGAVGSGVTIERCFSKGGSISGRQFVGGLIGVVMARRDAPVGYTKVRDCYATNFVSGSDRFGGLLGRSVTKGLHSIYVERCYAAGQIDEGGFGLVGDYYHGDFYDCFWDLEATGRSNSGVYYSGVTGKTTVEMKQRGTFTDWDFVNIWGVGESQTYPYLRTEPAGELNHIPPVDLKDFVIFAENWLSLSQSSLKKSVFTQPQNYFVTGELKVSGIFFWSSSWS